MQGSSTEKRLEQVHGAIGQMNSNDGYNRPSELVMGVGTMLKLGVLGVPTVQSDFQLISLYATP